MSDERYPNYVVGILLLAHLQPWVIIKYAINLRLEQCSRTLYIIENLFLGYELFIPKAASFSSRVYVLWERVVCTST